MAQVDFKADQIDQIVKVIGNLKSAKMMEVIAASFGAVVTTIDGISKANETLFKIIDHKIKVETDNKKTIGDKYEDPDYKETHDKEGKPDEVEIKRRKDNFTTANSNIKTHNTEKETLLTHQLTLAQLTVIGKAVQDISKVFAAIATPSKGESDLTSKLISDKIYDDVLAKIAPKSIEQALAMAKSSLDTANAAKNLVNTYNTEIDGVEYNDGQLKNADKAVITESDRKIGDDTLGLIKDIKASETRIEEQKTAINTNPKNAVEYLKIAQKEAIEARANALISLGHEKKAKEARYANYYRTKGAILYAAIETACGTLDNVYNNTDFTLPAEVDTIKNYAAEKKDTILTQPAPDAATSFYKAHTDAATILSDLKDANKKLAKDKVKQTTLNTAIENLGKAIKDTNVPK